MPVHDTNTGTTTTSPLRDYQAKGVDWLVERLRHPGDKYKAVLLADPAGLGKTLQVLTAAHRMRVHRMLVICPAGARRVWQLEIRTWFPDWASRVVLVEPGTDSEIVVRRQLAGLRPLILIVGYDEFSTNTPVAKQIQLIEGWDLLVLDEAHYLKNPSNRTNAIYGGHYGRARHPIQAHARRVILLSGTPTPNHAGEMFQHCRAFWPWTLPGGRLDRGSFEDAYTRYRDHPTYGRQVVGSRNQATLRELLQEVILRRRKDHVLPELPPLIVQDMPLVPGDAGPVDLDQFDAVSAAFPETETDRMIREVGNMARLRRQLGLTKVRAAVAWLAERMASTDKMLVFAWHLDVVDLLRRGLAEFKPAVLTGATSPNNRTHAIQAFQLDPNTRIFIGQIQAAGTAITLTAAHEVAIVEPSWVPADNVQAICRAHRLGQRDSVLASFLYLPDTLDERIMRTFRRKAAEIGQLEEV